MIDEYIKNELMMLESAAPENGNIQNALNIIAKYLKWAVDSIDNIDHRIGEVEEKTKCLK